MSDYLQPDFYRFNQDSLELVGWICDQVQTAHSILDLGAGSGIIGIELARALSPAELTLVELQKEFAPYLEHNLQHFLPKETVSLVHFTDLGHFEPKQKYDVIAVNPPYYLPGRGEPSVNQQKHLCRTFVQDGWNGLASCLKRAMAPESLAFLVIRNMDEIKNEMLQSLNGHKLCCQITEREKLLLVKVSLTE